MMGLFCLLILICSAVDAEQYERFQMWSNRMTMAVYTTATPLAIDARALFDKSTWDDDLDLVAESRFDYVLSFSDTLDIDGQRLLLSEGIFSMNYGEVRAPEHLRSIEVFRTETPVWTTAISLNSAYVDSLSQIVGAFDVAGKIAREDSIVDAMLRSEAEFKLLPDR